VEPQKQLPDVSQLHLRATQQPQFDHIQLLRAKAETLGNLKSTPEQTVTTRDEGGSRVIYVLPANPERIYVPVYDPGIAFSSSAAGAIAFRRWRAGWLSME